MERKKSRNLLAFVVVLAVVNLALLCGLVMLFSKDDGASTSQRDALARLIGSEVEQMSEETLEEKRLQLLSDGLRLVNYNAEAWLEQGEINIYLSNAENNTCSISAELTLLESGQLIASIGVIEPGYRLEKLKCDAELPAGKYACLMTLQVYTEDGTHLGRAGRHLTLSVN